MPNATLKNSKKALVQTLSFKDIQGYLICSNQIFTHKTQMIGSIVGHSSPNVPK